jgi:hypothetical protein
LYLVQFYASNRNQLHLVERDRVGRAEQGALAAVVDARRSFLMLYLAAATRRDLTEWELCGLTFLWAKRLPHNLGAHSLEGAKDSKQNKTADLTCAR